MTDETGSTDNRPRWCKKGHGNQDVPCPRCAQDAELQQLRAEREGAFKSSLDCDDMAAAYDAMKEPTASGLPALLETHANRLAEMGRYDIAADVQLASERLAAINAHAEQATEYVLAQINSDLRARIAALEAELDQAAADVAFANRSARDSAKRYMDGLAALEARDRLIADLVAVANKLGSGMPILMDSIIARAAAMQRGGNNGR